MKNWPDRYFVHARLFPGILSVLPLLVLWYFLAKDAILQDLGKFLFSIKFAGIATLSTASIYAYSMLIRTISKYFEKRYFVENRGFPTTYTMMYSDRTYSSEYKDKYRILVKHHFGINLLDSIQEDKEPIEAQKRLDEAAKQVIEKIGNGRLVLKHNIWYGFFRNLIGGTMIAVPLCVINILIGIFIFDENTLNIISAVFFMIYLLVFLFRKPILIQNAEAYAKQLISEFVAQN